MSRSLRMLCRLGVAVTLAAAPAAVHGQVALITSPVVEQVTSTGGMYTGRIVIANTSSSAQTVRISQSDGGSTTRSNTAWVTPQSPQIVVPPNTEGSIRFTVRVPQDDSLRGTYWSRILLEGSRGITAVQVATHVGTNGTRTISLERPAAAHDSITGSATLDLDVVATGERAVRPQLSAEVFDSTGTLRAKVAQTQDLLFPGSSLRQHFDFAKLMPGTYKVFVFADTGGEHVFASQFTIVF